MIHDLDTTLQGLLKRELSDISDLSVSFAAPDDQFLSTNGVTPAIDIFLYDVRENRDLRSTDWTIERQNNGTITKQRAPARVDCSYLITAWATDVAGENGEHMLLGRVMQALLRYPTLPTEVLQGRLKGQDLPPPTSVLQPGLLQSMGEFWQAMGGKPKAALHLTVTIGVEVAAAVEAGPPVTDRLLKLRQGVA